MSSFSNGLPSSALSQWDSVGFEVWHKRRREILDIAAPVFESQAFGRLSAITFLGILSPRFGVSAREASARASLRCEGDGSRQSHSLGVALLGLDLTRELGFSEATQRYAVAWGLLHDIGNWPLSHTGEFAFGRLIGFTTRELRREMIIGSASVPSAYSLRREISAMGLDVDCLLALLEHRPLGLPSELRSLAAILQSPLTPDTCEGVWRSGRVLGIQVPEPHLLARSFVMDSHHLLRLRPTLVKFATEFLDRKALIYRTFFNRADNIELESAWSRAILRDFTGISVAESLDLSEDDVVARVESQGLPEHPPFSRYKQPVEYRLDLPDGQLLPPNATLGQLSKIFVSRPLEM
jgi:hypothetical protein